MNILNFDIKIIFSILTFLITSLLIKPSLITLLTTRKTERLLVSKELRVFYKIILCLFFGILFPIGITYGWYEDKITYEFIIKFYNVEFVIFAILMSVVFILIFKANIINKCKIILENEKGKSIFLLLIILIMIYFWIGYGILFNETLRKYNDYLSSLPGLIVCSYIYILIIYNLHISVSELSHREIIKCNVKMDNGELIKDAYFLHPTYGNKIVLGNSTQPWEIKQTIIIPIKRIQYIEFLSKEIISWGKKEEVEIKNKIKIN
ncbi:hypothetical protein [Sporohalobacter salinus]|uniref:hypothetical protein n=1 Tax=Sporohalobacter salinus TaxID=1494606 RepID=UPI00195F4A99|nr:hypothetical protein [Sporohalobacter salinus]MBM7623700.1 hypothetical protein [Sporohalobacter salinus]